MNCGRVTFYLGLITTQIVAIENFRIMSAGTIKSISVGSEELGWQEVVRRQVESLSYGVVQIVVHDSQVTQIEKTERVRLDKPRAKTI